MNTQNVKVGTLTVVDDANVVNISVGFAPSYIRVVNTTDPVLFEFFSGMTDGSAIQTADHDTAQVTAVSTNYITPYDGRAAGAPITGTAAASAGGTTVTGTTTNFTGELAVGDTVIINGETKEVTAIASAVSMTVSPAFTSAASGDTIFELEGKAPGFTLGTSILDDDDDVIKWLAIR